MENSLSGISAKNGTFFRSSPAPTVSFSGWLDLFHVNGWRHGFLADPSRLFMSNGDGTFTEVSLVKGLVDEGQGRGVVCFDADRDGDIDIFVSNNGDGPSFYMNQAIQTSQASGGQSFADLGAGDEHTCGVTTDDSLYCWGGNSDGELGLGFTSRHATPQLVSGGLTFMVPPRE